MDILVGRALPRPRYVTRNIEGGVLLERFFVAAVAALLLLRFYLELTGFPQVGGHGLHIAHMLWGGLLMLIAVVILLGFLGSTVRNAAAVVGGIGFGLFIDEIGKFITSDNNYFYQPAIALIYVIFVLLFLALRAIERQRTLSDTGYLVNALAVTGNAVLRGFDQINRDHALTLLEPLHSSSPLAVALSQALQEVACVPDAPPTAFERVRLRIREWYSGIVRSSWYSKALIVGFLCYAAGIAITLLLLILLHDHPSLKGVSLSIRGDAVTSTIADLMILAGAITWTRSRAAALHWFKRSILVSLLLTQPFMFYQEQLVALPWLILDIVILEALNYMLTIEMGRPRTA